jgi:hypothetical protein
MSQDRRNDGTTTDTTHNKPGTAFIVTPKTADPESHNSREANGFKEEGHKQHR